MLAKRPHPWPATAKWFAASVLIFLAIAGLSAITWTTYDSFAPEVF